MSEYTPTTDSVRNIYRFTEPNTLLGTHNTVLTTQQRTDAFDRWYEAEKRKWQAEALREVAESAFYDGDHDRALHGYYVLLGRAHRIEQEARDDRADA